MSNLARQEIFFGRQFSLDEILARIASVTADDVRRMASDIFRVDQLAVTAVGPVDGLDLNKSEFVC
jgi:predicted Zn-dependent peptidase